MQWVDHQLWFDQLKPRGRGDAPYGWSRENETKSYIAGGKIAPPKFSVRWTGQLEAPLTEKYVFSTYVPAKGAGVRVKLDGRTIIDALDPSSNEPNRSERVGPYKLRGVGKFPGPPTLDFRSQPVLLKAGSRYRLVVEFRNTREKKPYFSLNRESFTLERRRVQRRYLYPD